MVGSRGIEPHPLVFQTSVHTSYTSCRFMVGEEGIEPIHAENPRRFYRPLPHLEASLPILVADSSFDLLSKSYQLFVLPLN